MESTAFIIPYRNRWHHFTVLFPRLRNLGKVILVEQADIMPFNRGLLCNIGADYAKEDHLIMHDVDMVPLNCDYTITADATHFAGAASQFNYLRPYPDYFGGVTGFTRSAFHHVNGFSNEFWGWGAEDDDLLARCRAKELSITLVNGRFRSLKHQHNGIHELYHRNVETLRAGINWESGLSNLDSIAQVMSITNTQEGYIHIKVSASEYP